MSQYASFSDQQINEIVKQIVGSVHPEEIFLFGSVAHQKTHSDSDIDLLVVESQDFGQQRSRRKELRKIWDALRAFTVPIDILLYSKSEKELYKKNASHVLSEALRTGKKVYER